MNIIKITDINLKNKRVFIRSDLNVPIINGKIMSSTRIDKSLPTIKIALKKGAKVILTSHLGRPEEGIFNINYSLEPIVNYLKNKFKNPIKLLRNYLNGFNFNSNEIIVLENVRFNKGEKTNDEKLSKQYANLCDIFIMDAFGSTHRIHSSTYGIAKFVPISCAGMLLYQEVKSLNKIIFNPIKPVVAIIGGSKISTKLNLLHSLLKVSDIIILGGGIANTFIAAKGFNIGKSLYENNFLEEAKILLKNKNILIPSDVSVSTEYSKTAISTQKSIDNIKDNEYIFDIGEKFTLKSKEIIKKAKTILWNGTMGICEFNYFYKGTKSIAHAITKSNAFSIVGGGDTIAALDIFGVTEKISYISTGGGAFLQFIQNPKLPILEILKKHSNNY